MSTYENVLLIGASGTLGSAVLQVFLDSQHNVTVLSRQGSLSKFSEGVRVIRADYEDSTSLKHAMQGQDVVVSMVGGEAAGDQNKFIDAALAAGVKRFIPSEFGPNTQDPRVVQFIPILPYKVETVSYLKSQESKMEWCSIVTGAWLDWGLKGAHFGFDIPTRTATIVDRGETEFTVSTLLHVGKAILATLEHAAESKNKYVYTSSFNLCQNDLLAVLQKIDGHEWTIRHEASKDIIEEGNNRFKDGDYSGIPLLVRALALGPVNLGDSRPAGLWDEKLGLERSELEEVVRGIVNEIRDQKALA